MSPLPLQLVHVDPTIPPANGDVPVYSSATSLYVPTAGINGNVTAAGTLTSNQVVIGQGTKAVATLGSLGTTTMVLHGNAAGAPSFAAVVEADLSLSNNTTNDVTTSAHGFAPKGTTGTTQFWRQDWTLAAPSGAGNVTTSATLASGTLIQGNGTNDITLNATTATVVKLASGVPSAATVGVDYIAPSVIQAATVTTDEIRNSASYGDMSTAGPSVTLTHAGTVAIIWISAYAYATANLKNMWISPDVSGANTVAASDANASVMFTQSINTANTLSRVLVLTGLTPGSTTFKLQYKADANNNGHFVNRSIAVFAP